MAMLGLLSATQVSKICKQTETRPINPIRINTVQEQLLLAMRFWVIERQRLQLPVDATQFNMIVALNQAQIMRQQAEDDARSDKEPVAKAPDKFKSATSWKIFAEALETYLGQILGSGRIPLRYIIRRQATPDPDATYANETELAIAMAPLTGESFTRDNVKVYGIIKQLVLEGPGRSYILPFDNASNGRAAWMALIDHFEGDGFRNRNVEDAYRVLEGLHYEGERKGFNFEKFIQKHMECYLELTRHNEPVTETKKVRDFLARIKATELQAAIQQVRATPELSASFTAAANFINLSVIPLKQNQRIIGGVNAQDVNRTKGDSNTNNATGKGGNERGARGGRGRGWRGGRGGRGNGRGRGRNAGRGTTHTGFYSEQDWSALTREQQMQVLEARGTKRNIKAVEVSDDTASSLTEPTRSRNGNSDGSPSQSQTPVQGAGRQFGRRSIGGIYTGRRARITRANVSQLKVDSSKDGIAYGRIELDSHADTTCVGKNFRVISFTDRVCEVSPYHPDYNAISNVPIVQAATAYDDPNSGETFILVFHECLFLGDALQNTLMNPNQVRANGIVVDDIPKHLSPNPQHATHSIYVPKEDLRIPLQLRGVISCFSSRSPSDQELQTCQWIEMTNSEEWSPDSNSFSEDEAQCERAMETIDSGRLPRQIYSMQSNEIDDLITNTASVNAATSKHRRESDELRNKVSKTFGIGLETASRTLKATTQLALRHALHPIHKRYTTKVAQLRYPRLTGRHGVFHTDTFFADTPTLSNCTIGQMYTNDVDFSKFYPMRRKGDVADTMIAFMQDIGIPSGLHSDNAKELTQGRVADIAKEFWIKVSQSEPYSPWQVRA